MAMGINEAWRDRHTFRVNYLGSRTDKVPKVVTATHRNEPTILDREGFGLW
jgi:hypothetical protein